MKKIAKMLATEAASSQQLQALRRFETMSTYFVVGDIHEHQLEELMTEGWKSSIYLFRGFDGLRRKTATDRLKS